MRDMYIAVFSSHRGVSVRKQLAQTSERRLELQIADILRFDPFQKAENQGVPRVSSDR